MSNSVSEALSSTVTAAEARAALPALSYGHLCELLAFQCTVSTADIPTKRSDLLYLHYLISRGNFTAVQEFLEGFDEVNKYRLVNDTDFNTHMGNTLHTCAYWNTGDAAVEMFDYLVSCGAKPIRNYYGDLPWGMYNGIKYVPIVNPLGIEPQSRNSDEFTDTYGILEDRYNDIVPATERTASCDE